MTELRVVRFFYIIFCVYICVITEITSITFTHIVPALVFLLVLFIPFSFGVKIKSGNISKEKKRFNSWLMRHSKTTFVLLGISSIICSLLVVQFYTGQTFISVLRNLTQGISSYAVYQEYFKQNQIDVFSVTKLPFIFMMAFVKFNMLYSIISVYLHFKNKIPFFYLAYLLVVTISFIYIGVARGTNFEMFEFVLLIIYVIFLKQIRIDVKKYLSVFFLIFIATIIFMNVIANRGGSSTAYFNISRDVFVNPNSFFVTNFSGITLLFLSIYSYFAFGFYYISIFIDKIWFSSFLSMLTYLFPFGTSFMSESNIKTKITNILDIGTRWHPDSILLMNKVGLIGLIFCCFLLGCLCNYFNNKKEVSSMDVILNFFVIFQMISFPIGNFIQVSSSSKIIIFMIVIYKLVYLLFLKGRYYENRNINY